MARRNLASAHQQKRKVSLIETINVMQLERFAANFVCKSLSTVKTLLKAKNILQNWPYFKNYDYLCGQNMTIL